MPRRKNDYEQENRGRSARGHHADHACIRSDGRQLSQYAHNADGDPDKVTKTSDKGVKKHRVHARASHGHKVHHAQHAKPNQVKHAKKISKKSLTSASTKSHTRTVAALPVKAPVKN
jgi:hypothetical protein